MHRGRSVLTVQTLIVFLQRVFDRLKARGTWLLWKCKLLINLSRPFLEVVIWFSPVPKASKNWGSEALWCHDSLTCFLRFGFFVVLGCDSENILLGFFARFHIYASLSCSVYTYVFKGDCLLKLEALFILLWLTENTAQVFCELC